jgi:transposase
MSGVIDNVKQKTIEPFIKDTIESGTLVYTDEYSIYARLEVRVHRMSL